MKNPRNVLSGWRYVGFVGCMVGALALAAYPIIISPMINPEPWRNTSNENRKKAGIKQEDIQPAGMKVWSDPFDRPGKPGSS